MATVSTAGTSPRSLFISYARKDGTDLARTLGTALEAAHHSVWLDTACIGGGASWSPEIESALSACDVLIALLTPASYGSKICRAEHIWALDEGKLVIPVLATADARLVPLYLKGRNYRKFPEQQAELLQDLGAQLTAAIEPYGRPLRYDTIPNLPQNHVTREGELCTQAGHSDWVDGVALTADGKRAVSPSDDNTLKVWDVDTGACIATFHCLVGDLLGHLHLLYVEGL